MSVEMKMVKLVTPGLHHGAYYTLSIEDYRLCVRAEPTAGCATITEWLLPQKDDKEVMTQLIKEAIKYSLRHKSVIRANVPIVDLNFIKALVTCGFHAADVVHRLKRTVELTYRTV